MQILGMQERMGHMDGAGHNTEGDADARYPWRTQRRQSIQNPRAYNHAMGGRQVENDDDDESLHEAGNEPKAIGVRHIHWTFHNDRSDTIKVDRKKRNRGSNHQSRMRDDRKTRRIPADTKNGRSPTDARGPKYLRRNPMGNHERRIGDGPTSRNKTHPLGPWHLPRDQSDTEGVP